MKFIDYYNTESEMLNESLAGAAAGGLLFAAILRELGLKSVPVYITKKSNVMPASRSAYQRLMDKFAVSYKEFLSAKKAKVNDIIDKVTGKKVTRNKMKDYKEKYNGAIVKKAYKGVLKSDGGQLGSPDDIKSVMVYRTNNGGTVTFINTEENGQDRYFVMMDDAAEKFFIKYQGSTISSYISKYNDRNYKSPGAFGTEEVDKMTKYYDDYIARDKARQMRDEKRAEGSPSEDEAFNARVKKHYNELLAKNVARDFAKKIAVELARKETSDSSEPAKPNIPTSEYTDEHKWVLPLTAKDYNLLSDKIDYLKTKKDSIKFTVKNVANLKGQSGRGKVYTFNDGSYVKLYYNNLEDQHRMEFNSDAALDNARMAGFFSIPGVSVDMNKYVQPIS